MIQHNAAQEDDSCNQEQSPAQQQNEATVAVAEDTTLCNGIEGAPQDTLDDNDGATDVTLPKTENTSGPLDAMKETDFFEHKLVDERKNERITDGCQDGWLVAGASVQGRNHVGREVPCQDCHGFKSLGDGWWIAVTADGAGSAPLSAKGSKFVVNSSLLLFSELIEQQQWKDKGLPEPDEWQSLASQTIKKIVDGMAGWVKDRNTKTGNNTMLKDYGATVIVVINSSHGLLVTHIGDGRAGYRNSNGEWKALFTPHKGSEANQTVFITSPFWGIPFFRLSGVWVPEARVIKEKPTAVVLMSDGCEHSTWECLFRNEDTGIYYDPNRPFSGFFEPLLSNLIIDKQKKQSKGHHLYSLLKNGQEFARETDDETMLIVFCDVDAANTTKNTTQS